ncbi:hypothetical protein QUV83_10025 [Cellulomonas cellasea]|uniref:hypothetical protein n=1 Tax=Cellulomonas cellasea TaxID=43670 RepID=UPI0025A46510|nr:hypothetical protein [Cellulomonas cellasea]MDM8085101.1 hypothetical protein [Cellulomonas cellasea]
MTNTEDRFAVHTHGIADIDFSSMRAGDLGLIAEHAAAQRLYVCPTIFLRRNYFDELESALRAYSAADQAVKDRIIGFGVEGPLLGTHGGVPDEGCWIPTWAEWERIASLGKLGLEYIVIGPDHAALDEEIAPGGTFQDLVDLFYQNGVRIALGHFRHDDPSRSARLVRELVEYVWSFDGCDASWVVTDHLYNDMPRNFVHAWRTNDERSRRDVEIAGLLAEEWTHESLPRILGEVPACLVELAVSGKLILMMNFDGEHVDQAVAKRTLDFLGPGHLAAMTDDIQAPVMAGQSVFRHSDNGLWYRRDGRVAACVSTVADAVERMRAAGYSEEQISDVFESVPRRIFNAPVAVGLRPESRIGSR